MLHPGHGNKQARKCRDTGFGRLTRWRLAGHDKTAPGFLFPVGRISSSTVMSGFAHHLFCMSSLWPEASTRAPSTTATASLHRNSYLALPFFAFLDAAAPFSPSPPPSPSLRFLPPAPFLSFPDPPFSFLPLSLPPPLPPPPARSSPSAAAQSPRPLPYSCRYSRTPSAAVAGAAAASGVTAVAVAVAAVAVAAVAGGGSWLRRAARRWRAACSSVRRVFLRACGGGGGLAGVVNMVGKVVLRGGEEVGGCVEVSLGRGGSAGKCVRAAVATGV